MMEKYIIWGAGAHAKLLMDSFDGLENYIELFIDSDETKDKMGNIVVAWGGANVLVNYPAHNIVIAVLNGFWEIYNELIFKYGCSKDRIFSSHEWICNLLFEKKIKISPSACRLEACTLCQLDCPFCEMRTGNFGTMGRGYLKYQDFARFVDNNPKIKRIELANNGEVFLNPELAQILRLAADKNIEITIYSGTNFNYVDDEVMELLVTANVSLINIAIDGASQEIYSAYRRKGNFNTIISNIKKLNAYKEKYHSDTPVLQWQYILMDHNECDVEKAIQMAEELNMKIWFKYECVRGKIEPKDREKLKKLTGLNELSLEEYNDAHIRTYGSGMCYDMIINPQVNWDGRLLGCCMLWDEDFGVNVFQNGLVESLNSSYYLDTVFLLLGMKKLDSEMKSPCIHCSQCGRNVLNDRFMYL